MGNDEVNEKFLIIHFMILKTIVASTLYSKYAFYFKVFKKAAILS
jgi:hypothetical protein